MQKRIQPPQAETLEGKEVAYYIGEAADVPAREEIFKLIESAGGKVVRFQRETKRSGASLYGANNTVAYKKAATTLLDALDSGADILVCADEKALGFFQEHFGMLQKEIGREILLSLVSVSQLKALSTQKEAVA
jgi:heterodisulfide reductase subunit B